MCSNNEKLLIFKFNPNQPYADNAVPAACDELREVKLHQLQQYQPNMNKLLVAKKMWYYREPQSAEYPINLNDGYERYIPITNADFFKKPYSKIEYFLQQQQNALSAMNNIHFFSNRRDLLFLMNINANSKFALVATKLRGHIFLCLKENMTQDRLSGVDKRQTYNFKLRQHVLVENIGDIPNTNAAVDERKKMFGIFSASLGEFNLMYSAEICGTTSSKPLGNLTDPNVLKQCNLTLVKVQKTGLKCCRRTREQVKWCMQAHFAGVKQFHVGYFDDKGRIQRPIERLTYDSLAWKLQLKMTVQLQLLHRFLQEINDFMMETAAEGKPCVFRVEDNRVYHTPTWLPNRNATLTKQLTDCINQLHNDFHSM